MNKCVFLDRDGVVNHDIGYASQIEDIEFVPEVFRLCSFLHKMGYLIIVITNQAGIARGYYSVADFLQLTHWMKQEFSKHRAPITDVFWCPHHPLITGGCHCRKPNPGMLRSAMQKYDIDGKTSFMIGDKPSDLLAAHRAGIANRILFNPNFNTYKRSLIATQTANNLASIMKHVI